MRTEEFLSRLRHGFSRMEGISLSVRNDQACPHFQITSPLGNTPSIEGYYCESGDSFIQVSHSGREEFTGNERSAEKFLELIQQVVDIISRRGCVEQRWVNSNGEVKRSVIDLQLREAKIAYRLGKAPHFWQVGLTPSAKRFAPFLSENWGDKNWGDRRN
jgi:hypothetical protein